MEHSVTMVGGDSLKINLAGTDYELTTFFDDLLEVAMDRRVEEMRQRRFARERAKHGENGYFGFQPEISTAVT